MENKQINVKQWLENYSIGIYNDNSFKTQCNAGWYDWFCKDSSLAGKTKKLAPKVKRIAQSKKINQETMYVWFKNNCPMFGSLYDDFRFADIETGDVIYTIIPSSGHDSEFGESSVWGRENDFNNPIIKGTWKDVCKFFEI